MSLDTDNVEKPMNVGDSEHALPNYTGGEIQVALEVISGTHTAVGEATIKVRPEGLTEYQDVVGGVIDLTAPKPLTIAGKFDSVKIETNGTDSYASSIVC